VTDDPQRSNLAATLDHIEAAIVSAQTAQLCEETTPVDSLLLESLVQTLRDQRRRLINIMEDR